MVEQWCLGEGPHILRGKKQEESERKIVYCWVVSFLFIVQTARRGENSKAVPMSIAVCTRKQMAVKAAR